MKSNIKKMKILVLTITGIFSLGGCAKQSSVPMVVTDAPQAVEPGRVEIIVFPLDPNDQKTCEEQLAKSGIKIAYRGLTGGLYLNQTLSSGELGDCKAQVVTNDRLSLDNRLQQGASRLDEAHSLSTLLKLIPAEEMGARSFVKDNPSFDGRGTVVAILDTGVELDHPMLQTTTTNLPKIIDFEDFSGEGRVALQSGTVEGESIKNATGTTFNIKGISGSDFKLGTFLGSTLAQAAALSATDTFADLAVLSYLNATNERRVRIDLNENKSFEDEVDIYDYSKSRLFLKLGTKKSLTTAVNISATGEVATLCFDDGAHGTHVAGIATGYDPSGLQGVAPGAQVIGVKIGDNRLSGGSTTTASMMLAIDYAVKKGAHIINLSYGIHSGSNVGKSAIDTYVDKIAKEKDIIFSISAGNEGPAMLTVGTPAGASLAITNGAYISKQTARDNYGYLGVEEDSIWYFSSVGPRFDGGWKPTLLAPGTALSSIPNWNGFAANYRGTSMASPETTGALALLLSAAQQSSLSVDRATITHAVYQGAKPVPNLKLIEQGHGLLNVPSSFEILKKLAGPTLVEYQVAVNSPITPDGKGAGVFVKSGQIPESQFTATITPSYAASVSAADKARVKTFRLESSAKWISAPANLWITNAPKTFQIRLDASVLRSAGVYSEKLSAYDEQSGILAFEIPVTVIQPIFLNAQNAYRHSSRFQAKVGNTKRIFLNIPAGTTALSLRIESEGASVWGQIADPEGRTLLSLKPTTAAVPPLPLVGNLSNPPAGTYELDIVTPITNRKSAQVKVEVEAYSLETRLVGTVGLQSAELQVQNNFTPLQLTLNLYQKYYQKKNLLEIVGDKIKLPFEVSTADSTTFSKIQFKTKTSKKYYDLMTDFPYQVFNVKGEVLASGGLELDSLIEIPELNASTLGTNALEIQGAFTSKAPEKWYVNLTEQRVLAAPKEIMKGIPTLIEAGQGVVYTLDLSSVGASAIKPFDGCASVSLLNARKELIQELSLCLSAAGVALGLD